MNIKSFVNKLSNPNQLVDLSIKKAPQLPKTITPSLNKKQTIEELASEVRLADAYDRLNEAVSNVKKAAINIKK